MGIWGLDWTGTLPRACQQMPGLAWIIVVGVGQGGESGLDCRGQETQETAAVVSLAVAEMDEAVRLFTQE